MVKLRPFEMSRAQRKTIQKIVAENKMKDSAMAKKTAERIAKDSAMAKKTTERIAKDSAMVMRATLGTYKVPEGVKFGKVSQRMVDEVSKIYEKYKDVPELEFKNVERIENAALGTVAIDKTAPKPNRKAKVAGTKFKTPTESDLRAIATTQPNITPMNVETRDSLHRGLVGMADRVQAPPWLQDKIALMDPDKLKEIYYENPQFFEVVFDYEDITYDEHFGGWLVGGYEMERIENFVRMYEQRYGEI